MRFKLNDEAEEAIKFISENFAQKSSPNDRMLDLDSEISFFGQDKKR